METAGQETLDELRDDSELREFIEALRNSVQKKIDPRLNHFIQEQCELDESQTETDRMTLIEKVVEYFESIHMRSFRENVEVKPEQQPDSLPSNEVSAWERISLGSNSCSSRSNNEASTSKRGPPFSTSNSQLLIAPFLPHSNNLGESKMAKVTKNKKKKKKKKNREFNEAAQFHEAWESDGDIVSAIGQSGPTVGDGLVDNAGAWDVGAGSGIIVNADDVEFDAANAAGDGLTGSSGAVEVGAGPGIIVNPDDVEFDAANAAGNGLTGGNGVVDIGAGPGIIVNTGDVEFDAVNAAGDGLTGSSGVIEVNVDTTKALTIDSANGIQVVVDGASGMRIDSMNGLQAKISDGLVFDQSGIAVNAGDGIDTSAGDVRAKVDVNSGLQLDSMDGIQVNAGTGMMFSAGALIVDCSAIAGNGLEESGGSLRVGSGDGINVNQDTVEVVVDTTQALIVDSISGIQVVADTNNGIQIDSTNGLQVKDGNALEFDGNGNLAVKAGVAVPDLGPTATTANVIDKINDLLQSLRNAELLEP